MKTSRNGRTAMAVTQAETKPRMKCRNERTVHISYIGSRNLEQQVSMVENYASIIYGI